MEPETIEPALGCTNMAKSNTNNVAESFVLPAHVLEKEKALHADLQFVSEKVAFSKLYADFGRNIRIRTGTNVYGVAFKADTYDTSALATSIIEMGYIRDPLTVSRKMIDGVERYEVLRGFRRYDAAAGIISAGIHVNVIKELQNIPCNVYSNLTREQENALINDQTAKQFAACEVLREVWRRLENGESWQVIGLHMAEQIERATGATGKSNDLKKATTQAEKLQIIQDWLNYTVNQFWQGVFLYGGPQCRKWLFLHYADKDGLIGDKDEKSPIRFTSAVWTGKEGLYKAIRADMAADQWDRVKGTGPEFEKRVAEIVAKQNAPKERKGKGDDTPKDGALIRRMAEAENRSEPIRQALESCLVGSPTYQLDQWDVKLNTWARKTEAFNAVRGHLPASVTELLSMAFDTSASADDFDAKLAALVKTPTVTPQPEATPEVEATPEAEKPHGKKAKSGKK